MSRVDFIKEIANMSDDEFEKVEASMTCLLWGHDWSGGRLMCSRCGKIKPS